MNIPKDMLPGTTHKTNNSGYLRIVKYRSSLSVDVEFVDTLFKITTQASNIRLGSVADMHDMKDGFIHKNSKQGNIEIVRYVSTSHVKVRFVDTGFVTVASASAIRRGGVYDRLFRSVFSVGFIGCGEFNSASDKVAYIKWHSMMQRCYSELYHFQKPSYIDCSVCSEWHNFQSFAEWHYRNYINNGDRWDLDKDIKIKGNKVYSPDTCQYVSPKDNAKEKEDRMRVNMDIINPNGDVVTVRNQAEFSVKNGINKASLCRLLNGKQKKSHTGWRSIYL